MSSSLDKKTFYITSPIFYPNGELHIGHAYTMIVCDIFSRYHHMMGESTYFLTGSDENSTKIEKTAAERKIEVVPFLDNMETEFKRLYSEIDASYDQFIRTGDKERHWPGAQKMWKKLVDAGDIYTSSYKGLYCPDCEAFYTEKDLIDGMCPLHHKVPITIEEENYFFKLSKYTTPIKEAIESGTLEILPVARKNEILSLLEQGLQDVSFSRPAGVLGRAIPVPGDDSQIMYVWCDALVNYISALGYGTSDESLFKKFWPADVHVIGKDILRFHAAIWPAMLLSAGLPLPRRLLVHGLIMSNGKKMSKSLGNSINPQEILNEYPSDAMRYYFARHIPLFDDGEMTMKSFKDAYNAGLANGIGNLTSRIMTMAISYDVDYKVPKTDIVDEHIDMHVNKSEYVEWKKAFDRLDIHTAAQIIWKKIADMDAHIQSTEPFKLIKTDPESAKTVIAGLVDDLSLVSLLLIPIIPDAARDIYTCIIEKRKPKEAIFARK